MSPHASFATFSKATPMTNTTMAAPPPTSGISPGTPVADMLARNWGMVALRGVAGIIFGLLILANPLLSLAVLVTFFGVYLLVDGVVTVVAAVANRRGQPRWGSLLATGLLGVAAGIVILSWPGWTALALGYLVAGWATAAGIGEIVAGIRLRKQITGEWMLILAGAVLVLLGLVLGLVPGAGALAAAWWIGVGAVILGAVRIAAAVRLWSWHRERAEERVR
jgi:uncharacterized membrane protein HdeD (DUF308 family)